MTPEPERGSGRRRRAAIAAGGLVLAAGAAWYVTALLTAGPVLPAETGGPPYLLPAPADTPAFIQKKCGECHPTSHPLMLARSDWPRVIDHMREVAREKFGLAISPEEGREIREYYLERCLDALPRLPPDPSGSPIVFQSQPLPYPDIRLPDERPHVLNVNFVDLDRDGNREILVCDGYRMAVSLIHGGGQGSTESFIAAAPVAAHTEVADWNRDGHRDIVVAVLGVPKVTDDDVGQVLLLTNDGTNAFRPRTLLKDVGRVADVRPGDFDGDGDVDFVVAVFGFIQRGQIGWLEQRLGGEFAYRLIEKIPGTVHVIPCELDGDGRLDFTALVSQHHEKVIGYLNRGAEGFEPRILWEAGTPLFGSSGMEMPDLDGDGDRDILLSNGDAFDIDLSKVDKSAYQRPWHGVHWLENRGNLEFAYRRMAQFYGTYRATAGDLDGDGDLDVVASSVVNDWEDPERKSLIWLENDGRAGFTAHEVARSPTHLATVSLGDLDGDGRLDIVAGGMHLPTGAARIGRVTIWWNVGPRK